MEDMKFDLNWDEFKSSIKRTIKDVKDHFENDYSFSEDEGLIIRKQTYPIVNFYNCTYHEPFYRMDVFLPYTHKNAIKTEIEDGQITISGHNIAYKEVVPLREEYPNVKQFSRTFRINKDVDVDKIIAKYENGMLQIFMPKIVKSKKKKKKKKIKID